MFCPAARPCSSAVDHKTSSVDRPLRGSNTCATSPAAYTSGALIRKYSSTTIPRSIFRFADFASSSRGRTPIATARR
jgi:hypothetical protein